MSRYETVKLIAMHVCDPNGKPKRDAVWGATVQRDADRPTDARYRNVSFWGARGRPLHYLNGRWTTMNEALDQLDKAAARKARESPPYREIDWRNSMYGLVEAINELGVLAGQGVRTQAQPEINKPGPLPVSDESPRLRVRRERRLE